MITSAPVRTLRAIAALLVLLGRDRRRAVATDDIRR